MDRSGDPKRGSGRLWRRLGFGAVLLFVLLLVLGAGLWAADYECWRTSDGAVRGTVSEVQRRIASSDWERACSLLGHQLQQQYAAAADSECSHGLRSVIEQVGPHLAPVTSTWVNEDQTSAMVTTRDRSFELSKPETAGCSAWRVDSIRRQGR
jgi:hypothetical protein